MSVDDPPSTTAPSADYPLTGFSASYLPCRMCGEGSLVYDTEREASVCRCCGATDD